MKAVFVGGVRHGLRHRVVRPLMLAAAVANTFMMFGFYSWQRYFLDLLGKELVWVNGVVAALVGLASILGNLAMGWVSTIIRTRTGVLIAARRRPDRHDHPVRPGPELRRSRSASTWSATSRAGSRRRSGRG